MQENFNIKESIDLLEEKSSKFDKWSERLSLLKKKEIKYKGALEDYKHKMESSLSLSSLVTTYWIAFVLAMPIGYLSHLPIALKIIGGVYHAFIIAVGPIIYKARNNWKLKIMNENLLVPLGKDYFPKKTRITRKLRKKTVESITQEKEQIHNDSEQLKYDVSLLKLEIQRDENQIREGFSKMFQEDTKRSPISNLDIRTQNALLLGQKESIKDISKVEAVQFVKKR